MKILKFYFITGGYSIIQPYRTATIGKKVHIYDDNGG